ncbi:MAG: hypothetical protein JKY53_14795 [Flavobacteriales bacterium]|nr:hypothetical protein [Flavobacteriales bacterium]
MADQSIFGDGNQAPQNSDTPVTDTPVTQPSSNQNQYGDHLSAIKNERGETKYNTVEEALQGAAHAQKKIAEDAATMQTLQQELITAREEAAKLKGALNVADLIKPQTPEPNQVSSPAEQTGLSEEQASELFKKLSVQQSEDAKRAQNVLEVVNTLKDKFGNQASDLFYKKAEELNLSKDQMNKLASESPKAALQMFEGVTVENLNPTQTSVNTTSSPAPEIRNGPLPKAEKSMLIGATSEDLKAEFARHKDAVYEKYGITA